MSSIKTLIRKQRVKEKKIDWMYRLIGILCVGAILIAVHQLHRMELFQSLFYRLISMISQLVRSFLSIFI